MIRLATDADAPAIAAIWNPVIACTTITFAPDEKTAAQVADLITPQTPCLVAVHAGQVAGFARYGPFRGGAGYRFSAEHTILLHPSARGQGIGRILLGALCDHAQGAGLHMHPYCVYSPISVLQHSHLGQPHCPPPKTNTRNSKPYPDLFRDFSLIYQTWVNGLDLNRFRAPEHITQMSYSSIC